MKVVMSAYGTDGDVLPLLRVGGEMAASGHDVTAVVPPGHAGRLPLGVTLVETADDVERDMRVFEGLGGDPREIQRVMKEHRERTVAAAFAALEDVVPGADLVVGGGVAYAARSMAEVSGARYRSLVYCPALLRSKSYAPVSMDDGAPATGAVGMGLAWMVHGAIGRVLGKTIGSHRERLGLAPIGDAWSHIFDAGGSPVVACDAVLAPIGRGTPGTPVQTAAVAPPANGGLSPEIEAFLAGGDAPVYVGFSGQPRESDGAVGRIVLEALALTGRRGVVASRLTDGLGPLPESVFACGFEPHAELLPRTVAVVHHGGAGTTAAALRAGRGQVVVPHSGDQPFWAARVAACGVGAPALRRRGLTADALARAIEAAADGAIAARATEVSRSLGPVDGARATAEALLA